VVAVEEEGIVFLTVRASGVKKTPLERNIFGFLSKIVRIDDYVVNWLHLSLDGINGIG
jgi:hypothetical protein